MSNSFDWSHLDGQSFQDLCTDLLVAQGFDVEDQGVGPDGGIDIIATETIKFRTISQKFYKWAVQARFRRNKASTVKPNELGNIGNLLSRFEADGFLLITNGRVTNKTLREIRSVSSGKPPNHDVSVWDNRILESLLSKHSNVMKQYFGISQARTDLLNVQSTDRAPLVRDIPQLPEISMGRDSSVDGLEARLDYYKRATLYSLGVKNVDTRRLALEAVYFYGCTLVDWCLAQYDVVVLSDAHRRTALRKWALRDSRFISVYTAFSDFELGYRFRLVGVPVPGMVGALIANFPILLSELVAAIDAIYPPP